MKLPASAPTVTLNVTYPRASPLRRTLLGVRLVVLFVREGPREAECAQWPSSMVEEHGRLAWPKQCVLPWDVPVETLLDVRPRGVPSGVGL